MFWLQENLILMKEMSKKFSTDQRFILKEITFLQNPYFKNITFFTHFLLSLNTFCILGPFPWPNKVSTNKADKAELSKAIIEIMFNTNKTEDFNNKHITHRANLYEAIKKWKKMKFHLLLFIYVNYNNNTFYCKS